MRKTPLIATLTVLLGCCSVLPCAAQHALDGDWIGGIDFGSSWQSLRIHLESEADGLTGTLDLPDEGRNDLPVSRVAVEFPRVLIEWQGDSATATCQGQLKDGGITGNFQQGETRATFQLAHVAKVEARTYEQYVGSYKLGPDRFVDIGTYDRLNFSDTTTGRTGWEALRSEVEKSRHEKWFGYARVGWFSSVAIPPDASTLKGLRDPISYDPVPILEHVDVPVLAFNGELDRSVNTKESVPIMERALRAKGNKDVTIIVLRKASHDLLDARTGYNSEYPRLSRHASGYWDSMETWLRKHVRVKR